MSALTLRWSGRIYVSRDCQVHFVAANVVKPDIGFKPGRKVLLLLFQLLFLIFTSH
jgi:hypothetical protein